MCNSFPRQGNRGGSERPGSDRRDMPRFHPGSNFENKQGRVNHQHQDRYSRPRDSQPVGRSRFQSDNSRQDRKQSRWGPRHSTSPSKDGLLANTPSAKADAPKVRAESFPVLVDTRSPNGSDAPPNVQRQGPTSPASSTSAGATSERAMPFRKRPVQATSSELLVSASPSKKARSDTVQPGPADNSKTVERENTPSKTSLLAAIPKKVRKVSKDSTHPYPVQEEAPSMEQDVTGPDDIAFVREVPVQRSPAHQRLVTDSDGGSTILSDARENSSLQHSVPDAIVTKPSIAESEESQQLETVETATHDSVDENPFDTEDSSVDNDDSSYSSEDSGTDEDEVMMWASKMFGVQRNEPRVIPQQPLRIKLKMSPEKRKVERPPSMAPTKAPKAVSVPSKPTIKLAVRGRQKVRKVPSFDPAPVVDEKKEEMDRQEEKRIREEAKPLTAEQIRAILGDEDFGGRCQSNWVRRSVRQPSRTLLNSKQVKTLVKGLKRNDPAMVVLKMKKYISDPDAPSCVLDATLEALEENTNCEALFIQNFNEGMRDKQVLHLLRVLQSPSCNIWCLNIGENYNVSTETWETFTKGLRRTKVTHMYASEHTITTEMKDEIRDTIRANRKKHDMHINPNNLDVIVQCTHCWWNPINAKALRPYLKNRGIDYMLDDKESQGLRGSKSEAPTV
eukprot:Nitzschia sp. Nitz4//scaffold1_size375055//155729//157817//NITZ4_000262-RA/size375055-snap-gene-0.198-mRNA-1//1//CDS//3329541003//4818//frame0